MEQKKLILTVDSRLSEIFKHEQATAVFDTFLPGVRAQVSGQAAMMGFTPRKLVGFTNGAIPESVLPQMDAAFSALCIFVSEQQTQSYTDEWPILPAAAHSETSPPADAVYPGEVWRDTNGVRIQAHGGALLFENDTFYWYGENKDRTDGECPIWTWGIRAYSSHDLCNWTDLGLIIPPDLIHPANGLYPEKHVDRPHILKCDATGKYVCWIKQSGAEACFLILQADAFTGPYTVVTEQYRPLGMKVGDFDLFKDDATGKVYLFMDGDHSGMVGMELSVDFCSAQDKISMQYQGLHAPFCREAPAVFRRKGKFYMLTSGMTGYVPNKSDVAVSDSISEPFVSIGNPHPTDESNSSFNSQISQVFKVPGKQDLYITLADRWVPEFVVDARRADMMQRSVASHYDPERYAVTPAEQKEVMSSPMLESANTSIANYVWLPIEFEGEMPTIPWRERWSLEEFD